MIIISMYQLSNYICMYLVAGGRWHVSAPTIEFSTFVPSRTLGQRSMVCFVCCSTISVVAFFIFYKSDVGRY